MTPSYRGASRATRTIYLVRHGEADDEVTTDPAGPGLTALGRHQAALLAARLGRLPVRSIVTSPLRRATETAAIVRAALPGVPVAIEPLLAECRPSVPAEYLAALADVPAVVFVQGRRQVAAAMARFFAPAAHAPEHEVLVCHGNIMRAIMLAVLRAPVEHWVYAVVHCCGMTQVEVDGAGRLQLLAHNDTGHLPAEMLRL